MSTSSLNETLTVVFVETTPAAYDLVTGDSLLSVVFQGTFADGSPFGFQIEASSATIKTHGDGASGNWHDTGFSFEGTNDLKRYIVEGNNIANNISGTMVMESVAPAHFPCGPNRPSSKEQLLPDVYWANAIPDSKATINFTVNGRVLSFVGAGYHDKNWGVTPFRNVVQSWYWGHGQLGPYSLLWLDGLTTAKNGTDSQTEYVGAYVARDGEIILGTCQDGAVKVRPHGRNSDYPPQPSSGVPEYLTVEFNMGDGKRLVANVTTELIVVPSDDQIYGRYVGRVSGGIVGKEQFTGKAIWEQFKYALDTTRDG